MACQAVAGYLPVVIQVAQQFAGIRLYLTCTQNNDPQIRPQNDPGPEMIPLLEGK